MNSNFSIIKKKKMIHRIVNRRIKTVNILIVDKFLQFLIYEIIYQIQCDFCAFKLKINGIK